jgi:hypothetical protein
LSEDLPEKEAQAGCPSLAEGHPPSIAEALDHLARTLERTHVRTIDVRRGPGLTLELEEAVRAHDDAKAVKTACVLTHRASLVVDGLDRATARFQRVNVLRDQHWVSSDDKARFDALVNEASAKVAVRDYAGACATLETLLVFLGDPTRPSGNLPRP